MKKKPLYLSAGGHPLNAQQMIKDWQQVLAACDKPLPQVAYIGTANGDSKLFFQAMKSQLTKAGAGKVEMVRLANNHADVAKAKEQLKRVDAVFISGGEVEDGMAWLIKHQLVDYLKELYNCGTLFFGVSAGVIMLGQYWVHWDKEGDDTTASLFPCLGFTPYVFDTHGEKENWAELKCALRLLGSGAQGHGLSAGGFFSADESGCFVNLRNNPAVFRNAGGIIERLMP